MTRTPLARYLTLILLGVICFSFATILQPRVAALRERSTSDSILKVLLGEGRRLFANHFFVQADVSFHSGYYPTIFDQKPKESAMVSGHDEHDDHDSHANETPEEHAAHAGHEKHENSALKAHHDEEAHEKEMAFLGKPRDWIEGFGRNFLITEHTHLEGGREREILPWLWLSAELDPQRVETYTVASYWLRTLTNTTEAEKFLREGLRNNPRSADILFSLGQLYYEDLKEPGRARNVWELGLRRWQEARDNQKKPTASELFLLEQITVNLGHLEVEAGNYDKAISYLELGKKASPHPQDLDAQIAEIRQKQAGKNPVN